VFSQGGTGAKCAVPILTYLINIAYLVGGLEHDWIMTFHSVGNVIIPDELIFFRGVQTTNQLHIVVYNFQAEMILKSQ